MAFIEIHRQAFINNINTITQKARGIEAIAIVLKDNAYGHGLQTMATLAQEAGIIHAVVRTVQEANAIKSRFKTIMILAPKQYEASDEFFYVINSLEALETVPSVCNIELKVDTGMHRNGIAMAELDTALRTIKDKNLQLCGVLSHHRSADELGSAYFWQERNFRWVKAAVKTFCKEHDMTMPRFHNKNSAALFRANTVDDDLVRIGIAAYGLLQLPTSFMQPKLEPVMSLVATCNSVRTLQEGEAVGYGGSFIAKAPLRIGNYDVGYADGVLRVLSNSYTTPSGATLVGRVSMDNSSFTASSKELVIFNNANTIAKAANTLAYEVLVGMNAQFTRVVI